MCGVCAFCYLSVYRYVASQSLSVASSRQRTSAASISSEDKVKDVVTLFLYYPGACKHCAVLCCVVLCCAVLSCAVLCCAVLCCDVL